MSNVNSPAHYVAVLEDNFRVECLDIIDSLGMSLNRGSAFQYIWRAGRKEGTIEKEIEDLEKAVFYLNREIKFLKRQKEELDDVPF